MLEALLPVVILIANMLCIALIQFAFGEQGVVVCGAFADHVVAGECGVAAGDLQRKEQWQSTSIKDHGDFNLEHA